MATYTGTSIVDYLKSTGQASDYASRASLATQKGITGYAGTADQNTQLLNILRGGTTPTTPSNPLVGTVFDPKNPFGGGTTKSTSGGNFGDAGEMIKPVNVNTNTGQKEMTTDGSPALTPDVGGIVAAGTGASTSGQTAIDTAADNAKRLQELKDAAAKDNIETEKNWMQKLLGDRETEVANRKSTVEMRQEALDQAYSEMGVTPEQIQKIGGLIGEITAFNQQLADLEVAKTNALNVAGAKTGQDLAFMGREQNEITKKYNSEIAAKGVQAAVKVQELQMIQGAYDDAKATAAQIVQLMTYDQQQKVADIEWSLGAHQDMYNLLTKEEQNDWDRQYTLAKDELARVTNEERQKQDMIIDAANKGVNLSYLSTSSLIDIQKAYAEQVSGKISEVSGTKITTEQNDNLNLMMAELENKFQAGDTRDKVFQYLDRNNTYLRNNLGEEGYIKLRQEAEKIFPQAESVTTPGSSSTATISPAAFSAGGTARGVVSKVAGGITEPFVSTIGRTGLKIEDFLKGFLFGK